MLSAHTNQWLQGVRSLSRPDQLNLAQRVHRNTVWRGWLDALMALYPSVQHQLGQVRFDHLCRLYLDAHPPQQPVLLDMGADFAEFLRDSTPIDSLADQLAVADWAWMRAHVAPDAQVLDANAFSALWTQAHAHLCLHPSVQVLTDLPPTVIQTWLADRFPTVEPEAKASALLVHRVDDSVQAQALNAANLAFLLAASDGDGVQSALCRALEADPHLNLASWGTWLWDSQILCACPSTHQPGDSP